jgi:hypothetical protein
MLVLKRGFIRQHGFKTDARGYIFNLPVTLRQRLAEKRRLLAPLFGLVQ